MAKTTLEQLLVRCATPLKDEEKTEELLAAQDKSFHMVTHDLVREVTSPNSTVRKQAMHSLQVLAHVTGKSVTVIMEPHKEVNSQTDCNGRPDICLKCTCPFGLEHKTGYKPGLCLITPVHSGSLKFLKPNRA